MNAIATETKDKMDTVNTRRVRGEKFIDKYGVETFQIYKALPEKLLIPPPNTPLYDADGHVEFDEHMVREIDKDGDFAHVIVVWSDPDRNKLFVIDGRGCKLAIEEVNRRRAEDGRKPVLAKFIRFDGEQKRAIEHVTLRNFHRKRPTLGHYAREVVKFFNFGYDWDRIGELLHLDSKTEGGEIRLRRLAALAHCIPDVVAAVEAGRLSIRVARQFGGKEMNGSDRLGEDEQYALLAEKLNQEPREKSALTAADKKRIAAALRDNSAVQAIKRPQDREAARVAAAVMARLGGDPKALGEWPELAMVVNSALVQNLPDPESED